MRLYTAPVYGFCNYKPGRCALGTTIDEILEIVEREFSHIVKENAKLTQIIDTQEQRDAIEVRKQLEKIINKKIDSVS